MPLRRFVCDRFIEKIVLGPSGCWLWTAGANDKGYAWFRGDNGPVLGHVFAYEFFIGSVPNGLELDHLCRVRRCVNPTHVEPVTHQINMARGFFGSLTACFVGHPLNETNTYVTPSGHRCCRVCRRRRQQEWLEHRRAAS